MRKGVRATLSVAALAVVALVAMVLAGCGGGGSTTAGASGETPTKGGTLEMSQGPEITTLDPTVAIDQQSIQVLSQIMEPLFKANAEAEVEPCLALRAEPAEDDRSWTIDLRKGVKFSDGTPMTAEDVVFSIEAARNSVNWGSLFEAFQQVKATSPSTVLITTKEPVPAMEAILSSYSTVVVPKDYGGKTEKQFAQEPLGTGPYELGRWDRGQSLSLTKNPGYWESDRPFLDEIVIKAVPDDSSRVAQIHGGDLEAIEKAPFAQLKELETSPDLVVEAEQFGFSRYLALNSRGKLFGDERIREAINIAIDRNAVVETAMRGYGKLGAAFLAPEIPYHDSELTPPKQDIARAKQLVAEAKKDGASTSFTILTAAGAAYDNLSSQIIQQDLEEAGFTIELQPLDESALYEKLGTGDFEAALGGLGPGILDPSENTAFYIGTEAYFTGADTTQVAKLAAEGSAEVDPAKRQQIYYRIQQIVAEQKYLLTIGYEPYVWVLRSDIAGFEVNPLNLVWLSDVGHSE